MRRIQITYKNRTPIPLKECPGGNFLPVRKRIINFWWQVWLFIIGLTGKVYTIIEIYPCPIHISVYTRALIKEIIKDKLKVPPLSPPLPGYVGGLPIPVIVRFMTI